jgi:hypothetical protein
MMVSLEVDVRSMPLLNQISAELMRGGVYCDAAGEQLTSPFAVLDCMRAEGKVMQELPISEKQKAAVCLCFGALTL